MDSLATRRHFSLRFTYLIGTAAAKTGHRSRRQLQRSRPPWCRLTVGAAPQIGGRTMSGAPQSSGQSKWVWQKVPLYFYFCLGQFHNKRIGDRWFRLCDGSSEYH
jgi:hypothetical protein